jgi:hypothetical protein
MPPMFHSTSVSMRDDSRDQRRALGWAMPASVVLHLLIAALLVFGLPISLPQPQKEHAIAVELVPPPKPAEKAKAEPPPPAAEKSKSEKPQKTEAEKPSKSDDAAHPPRSAVLRPVFQFGEKDAGPRQSADGNRTKDGSAPPAAQRNPDKQEGAGPPVMTAPEAKDQVPKSGAPATAASKPTVPAKVEKPEQLQEAKTLFSRTATGDPLATTAMGSLPRSVRAGQLCASELSGQLLNASPSASPDLVPAYRLNDGTILDVRQGAFRANRQWFNVSFRCEVDADVTKVMSFAFRVGDPVPPSQWKRRGLPSQ